jgi:ubiquinol-cytochrome c reductase cytochrome b subunit
MQLAPKHASSRSSWFDGLREIFKQDLERAVPARVNFPHYLGALAFVFFAFQIITGILLMVYYRPSTEEAYISMAVITDEMRLGWLVQGLHRWGTDLLLLLAMLHMGRIYFTRTYRALRSFNWFVGLLLLLCFLAFTFTGTLLPWDQYAYWSITSARGLIADVPLVGNFLLELLWGGEAGEDTLLRFYVFHVGILPWMTVVFLCLHFYMVRRVGIQASSSGESTPFFPDFLIGLSIAALFMFGLLLVGAVFWPPQLLEPVDPLSPLAGVKPQWYFLPLYELLRHFSGGRVALIVAGFFLLLFLVPALDRSPKEGFWRSALVWLLGVVAFAAWFLIGLRGYMH